MRTFVIGATLLIAPTVVGAQETPVAAVHSTTGHTPGPTTGAVLRDSTGARVGKISRVLANGSVQVIVGQRLVAVPAETLTTTDNQIVTSLSRRDLDRLR